MLTCASTHIRHTHEQSTQRSTRVFRCTAISNISVCNLKMCIMEPHLIFLFPRRGWMAGNFHVLAQNKHKCRLEKQTSGSVWHRKWPEWTGLVLNLACRRLWRNCLFTKLFHPLQHQSSCKCHGLIWSMKVSAIISMIHYIAECNFYNVASIDDDCDWQAVKSFKSSLQ